jgi:hypothetical protein
MFSNQNFVRISKLSYACYMPRPSHPRWLDDPNNATVSTVTISISRYLTPMCLAGLSYQVLVASGSRKILIYAEYQTINFIITHLNCHSETFDATQSQNWFYLSRYINATGHLQIVNTLVKQEFVFSRSPIWNPLMCIWPEQGKPFLYVHLNVVYNPYFPAHVCVCACCYHSVQNFLLSFLFSQNLKIKVR